MFLKFFTSRWGGMGILTILRLKGLIVIRGQFETTANKIADFLGMRISSAWLYVIAAIVKMELGFLLAFIVLRALNEKTAWYMLFFAGGFCVLNAYMDGKKYARFVADLEEDTLLLASQLSDGQIYLIKAAEALFSFLATDFAFFIPVVPPIFYFSTSWADFLVKTLLFFALVILVFLVSNNLAVRKLRGGGEGSTLISEGMALVRHVILICLGYLFALTVLRAVFRHRIRVEEFAADPLGAGIKFNSAIKEEILPLLKPFFQFLREATFYLSQHHLGEALAGLLVLSFGFRLVTRLNPVRYRFLPGQEGAAPNRRQRFVAGYAEFLKKMGRRIFPGNVYLEKDLILLRELSQLIFTQSGVTYLFLSPSFPLFYGVLLFLLMKKDPLARLLLWYHVSMSVFNLTQFFKYLLGMVVTPASEMRNIELVKCSGYGVGNLIRDKVNLMRLLMVIPVALILLQVFFALVVTGSASLADVLLVTGMAGTGLLLAPLLQLYGELFYSRYNYKSYEQIQDDFLEIVVFYNKFYQYPRNLLVYPALFAFINLMFFDLGTGWMEKVSFWYPVYYFGLSGVLAVVVKVALRVGERAFAKKIIDVD